MGLERGMQAVVTAIVFNILAFSFILLRLISRFWVIHHAGPEDYLIVLAMICSVGTTITIALQKNNGLGRHSDTVTDKENETLLKLLYASIILYNFGLFLVKDSILYQYLRFFVHRRYRMAAWFLIGLVMVAGISFILTSVFSCWPIALYWNKKIQNGHCINLTAFWFSFSGFNILTDLLVWILPMPVLYHLQLPRKQKISLMVAFALGGFGCITALLRLHALYVACTSTDITYNNVGAATWSAVELNVGIMCACIPALRPIISMMFPRLLSSTRRGHGSSNAYPSRSTFHQNDSVVELSHAAHVRSEISRDDQASFDHSQDPGCIRVKNEWSVDERERL